LPPVIHDSWIYAGLEDGSLIGFATHDEQDTGWPMWGGGAGYIGLSLPIQDSPSEAKK
jgi:hypothetical protein